MDRQTDPDADLLLRIRRKLPDNLQQRFDALVKKRQTGAINKDELDELIAITDQSEQLQAERVQDLAELAARRNTTVASLMHQLGIRDRTWSAQE